MNNLFIISTIDWLVNYIVLSKNKITTLKTMKIIVLLFYYSTDSVELLLFDSAQKKANESWL